MQIYTVYMQPALASSCFAGRNWTHRLMEGRRRLAEAAPRRRSAPSSAAGRGLRSWPPARAPWRATRAPGGGDAEAAYSWRVHSLLAPLVVPALCRAIYQRSFLLFSQCWTALPVKSARVVSVAHVARSLFCLGAIFSSIPPYLVFAGATRRNK
jgi:hypothetical protein